MPKEYSIDNQPVFTLNEEKTITKADPDFTLYAIQNCRACKGYELGIIRYESQISVYWLGVQVPHEFLKICHTHTVEFDFATCLSLRVLGEASPQPEVSLAHVRDSNLHLHVVEGGLARYLGQLVLAFPRMRKILLILKNWK